MWYYGYMLYVVPEESNTHCIYNNTSSPYTTAPELGAVYDAELFVATLETAMYI